MRPTEIRAVVGQFLALLEEGEVVDDEALSLLLDKLAFAQHFVQFTFDEADYPDSPKRDQVELRRLVSRRFPDYGFYNVPESVTKEIAESSCMVADAIDDIIDITNDLLDVEWQWANTSEAEALWRFQNSYFSHWQGHLRGLQFYIFARYWEAP